MWSRSDLRWVCPQMAQWPFSLSLRIYIYIYTGLRACDLRPGCRACFNLVRSEVWFLGIIISFLWSWLFRKASGSRSVLLSLSCWILRSLLFISKFYRNLIALWCFVSPFDEMWIGLWNSTIMDYDWWKVFMFNPHHRTVGSQCKSCFTLVFKSPVF